MNPLLLVLTTCYSSIFGYRSDTQAGGNAVCLGRRIQSNDIGVAHRTLPCGTRLLLINPRTSMMTTAIVIDHGPYGAILNGEWVLKRKRTDPGRYRGCLDLTPGTAKRLAHNGFEKISYMLLSELNIRNWLALVRKYLP